MPIFWVQAFFLKSSIYLVIGFYLSVDTNTLGFWQKLWTVSLEEVTWTQNDACNFKGFQKPLYETQVKMPGLNHPWDRDWLWLIMVAWCAEHTSWSLKVEWIGMNSVFPHTFWPPGLPSICPLGATDSSSLLIRMSVWKTLTEPAHCASSSYPGIQEPVLFLNPSSYCSGPILHFISWGLGSLCHLR